jgi:hypothetical protein
MNFYNPADPRWSTEPGLLFDDLRRDQPGFTERPTEPGWPRATATPWPSCAIGPRRLTRSMSPPNVDPRHLTLRDAGPNVKRSCGGPRTRDLFSFAIHRTTPAFGVWCSGPSRLVGSRSPTPFLEETTDAIISAHLDGKPFDAVQELAWTVPVAVICEMLAIPASDHESFQRHSALLARGLDPEFLLDEADLERSRSGDCPLWALLSRALRRAPSPPR